MARECSPWFLREIAVEPLRWRRIPGNPSRRQMQMITTANKKKFCLFSQCSRAAIALISLDSLTPQFTPPVSSRLEHFSDDIDTIVSQVYLLCRSLSFFRFCGSSRSRQVPNLPSTNYFRIMSFPQRSMSLSALSLPTISLKQKVSSSRSLSLSDATLLNIEPTCLWRRSCPIIDLKLGCRLSRDDFQKAAEQIFLVQAKRRLRRPEASLSSQKQQRSQRSDHDRGLPQQPQEQAPQTPWKSQWRRPSQNPKESTLCHIGASSRACHDGGNTGYLRTHIGLAV